MFGAMDLQRLKVKLGLKPGPEAPEAPEVLPEAALPIVWLLGKTGAGKSSLIRALTGESSAAIGNGFAPCTPSSRRYDYPADAPLLRFLDTRGLGEAGYDPAADLAACRAHAHAILVLCRLDDPVQGEIADALAEVSRRARTRAILVHSGADLVTDPAARARAQAMTRARINAAAGRDLTEVTLALPAEGPIDAEGRAALVEALVGVLPAAGLLLARRAQGSAEEAAFQAVRGRVLFYAGLAGSSDVAPVIGAVSVPAAQVAMLRELGQHYGTPWTKATMAGFGGALGLGIGTRLGAGYALRQLGKLVPVYGQTIGAAVSGTLSFAVTFALGRAAAFWLHSRGEGRTPDPEELRAVYRRAFSRANDTAETTTQGRRHAAD